MLLRDAYIIELFNIFREGTRFSLRSNWKATGGEWSSFNVGDPSRVGAFMVFKGRV